MATRTIGLTLGAAVLAAMAMTAVAGEHCDPFDGMGRLKWLLKGAELTPDQVSQVFALRGASRQDDQQLSDNLKSLRNQFDEKFTSTGQLDVQGLTALQEQILQVGAQRDQLNFQTMVKVRALLTSDQLARVDETHQRVVSLDAEKEALPPTIAGEGDR
jgi:Spy/CpxP family protein refolding chaperone